MDISGADRLPVRYSEPQDLTWEEALSIARQQPMAEVAEGIGRSISTRGTSGRAWI